MPAAGAAKAEPQRNPANAAGKVYIGLRDQRDVCSVWIKDQAGERRELPLRLDLRRHSPSGFNWGYAGSGCAQLALALLADAIGDERAQRIYQDFKFAVIVPMGRESWTLTHAELMGHVAVIERAWRKRANA